MELLELRYLQRTRLKGQSLEIVLDMFTQPAEVRQTFRCSLIADGTFEGASC